MIRISEYNAQVYFMNWKICMLQTVIVRVSIVITMKFTVHLQEGEDKFLQSIDDLSTKLNNIISQKALEKLI
jgi:hypothetical protein